MVSETIFLSIYTESLIIASTVESVWSIDKPKFPPPPSLHVLLFLITGLNTSLGRVVVVVDVVVVDVVVVDVVVVDVVSQSIVLFVTFVVNQILKRGWSLHVDIGNTLLLRHLLL